MGPRRAAARHLPRRSTSATIRAPGEIRRESATIVDDLSAAQPRLAAFIAESAARASADRSSCRTAIWQRSTRSSAPPAASASPTKCRPPTAAWATHFYAFEAQGVVPDIVVLGKPIGNGYPLGAVVTTPEIAASFDNGMEFFSTFGGSTVSCAVGLAVLDVSRRSACRSTRASRRRAARALRRWSTRHALVGDVRGSGCSSASSW